MHNSFYSVNNTIYNEHGRPVVVLPSSYWAEKVAGYMNKEALEKVEAYEKTNFASLAHQMNTKEELEEDEPAIYDSSYHPNIELKVS